MNTVILNDEKGVSTIYTPSGKQETYSTAFQYAQDRAYIFAKMVQ